MIQDYPPPQYGSYDIFRANVFYFEDKYYLGKNVKAFFAYPYIFSEQYYTAKQLLQRQEYNIEHILCSSMNYPAEIRELEYFEKCFPDILRGDSYFSQIKEFESFIKFHDIYNYHRITSGIYMCALGIAMGYKEIYLTGIDFYSGPIHYPYNVKTHNLKKLFPSLEQPHYHTPQIDQEALKFLHTHYDVKFYALSPNSILTNYIPLAPITGAPSILEEKPKNYIHDMLIPNQNVYERFPEITFKNPYYDKSKFERLKTNIYYRIFKDFLRLPSDIKHYLRGKKCKR